MSSENWSDPRDAEIARLSSLLETKTAECERWKQNTRESQEELIKAMAQRDYADLQNDVYRKALQHIIGFYGPGADGSPEEVAGKLAREALEETSFKKVCVHEWSHIEDNHYWCPLCRSTKDERSKGDVITTYPEVEKRHNDSLKRPLEGPGSANE